MVADRCAVGLLGAFAVERVDRQPLVASRRWAWCERRLGGGADGDRTAATGGGCLGAPEGLCDHAISICSEHRAPSTEDRAPSPEHRAPSTEHRKQNSEHRTQGPAHLASFDRTIWPNPNPDPNPMDPPRNYTLLTSPPLTGLSGSYASAGPVPSGTRRSVAVGAPGGLGSG